MESPAEASLSGRALAFAAGRPCRRRGEDAPGAYVVFAVSVGVCWLQALVVPLAGGRDFGTYLGAYVELFQSDPVDLGYVLGRTPGAPLVVGALLDPLGGALAELGTSLLYAASVTAWFLAARRFGGRAALASAAVLLLYPGCGILFHELASDTVFAVAFAGWSLLVVRVLVAPAPAGFAFLGAGVAVLVLVRPGNQALLAFAAVPLVLRLGWKARLGSTLAFLAAALALLGAWTAHNGLRFGDYTVARGGSSRLPFERAFLTDRIVRARTGPRRAGWRRRSGARSSPRSRTARTGSASTSSSPIPALA
jgi:hypothetical protein